jgi:PIN domain nuclease of toxin-antitoxin system
MGEQVGQQVISYLDTNVVVFLHSGNAARLTRRAIEQIESTDLLVSAMVMLELEMLYEKGTINYSASQILSDLNQQIGVSVCQLPMAVVMNSALQIKWTRDPGDRVIVANAIANNEVPLVTSDRRIHEQYPNAIW